MHGSTFRFRFLYRCIVVSLYRFLVVAQKRAYTRVKIGKDIEKATKNNLKFRLKCRDLKIKSSETKAELFTNTIGFCTSV